MQKRLVNFTDKQRLDWLERSCCKKCGAFLSTCAEVDDEGDHVACSPYFEFDYSDIRSAIDSEIVKEQGEKCHKSV